jgi:hypothetical protein
MERRNMKHLPRFRTDGVGHRDIGPLRRRTRRSTLKPRLVPYILGVLMLIGTSLVAIADQSSKFVGAHELAGVHGIPSFVSDRVELPPGQRVSPLASDAAGELHP